MSIELITTQDVGATGRSSSRSWEVPKVLFPDKILSDVAWKTD